MTSEVLQCPARLKRSNVTVGKGYSTLSSNIVRFSELHELPMPIDISCLDEGGGIEATLLKHKAKWHNPAIQNSTPRSYSERKRGKLPWMIVTWNVLLLKCTSAQKTIMN